MPSAIFHRLLFRFLVLGLPMFLMACSSELPADLIIHRAQIWTGREYGTIQKDQAFAAYTAIAVRGDSIIALGSDAAVLRLRGEKTRIIDAGGRMVMPGFNDAHIHFLGGSIGLTQVELSSTRNHSEVVEITNKFIKENPNARWITGRGWQYTFYAGGLPDHQQMADIRSDKPLFIRAYDGHSAYANPAALKLAGIDRTTRFTGFGEIVRDARGEPTGLLKESAMGLVGQLVPPLTREEKLAALRKGMTYAASLGITSAQNASGSIEDVQLFLELLRSGAMTLRYAAAFSVDDQTDDASILRLTRLKDSIGISNPMLRADAVKFMIDGVIEGHTASMIAKYDDLTENDPLATGQMAMSSERFQKQVARFDKNGFRVYTHAIGDLGVRTTLDAYAYAAEVNGKRDSRHRVEHIETISDADLPRFAALGVMASMEPIHADPATIAVWEQSIGTARLANSFAWRSLLNHQAPLVYSSDWPAAISLNPIRGIHVAVNRRTPEGLPEGGWVPQQAITIEEALHAYTAMGAWSSFEEKKKGVLAPGKYADLIMLSDNLLTIDPMKIAGTRVLLTVVGGKVVYEVK